MATLSDEQKERYARNVAGALEGARRESPYAAMVYGMWCHTLNLKPTSPSLSAAMEKWRQDGYAASVQARQDPEPDKTKKKKK